MKNWIGHQTNTHRITVTSKEISAFATSILLEDPVYFDQNVAKASNYIDIPLPYTMPITFWKHFDIPWLDSIDGLVHTNQSFTYYQPLVANRTYSCHLELNDVSHKVRDNSCMTFLPHTLSIFYENELQATSKTTLLLLEGRE